MKREQIQTDVLLVGAGVMSATLATFLHQLAPDLTIHIFERLDKPAAESSDAWNNAGTGHSALCELNYTPQKEDGSIDTGKAIKITEDFEVSKQFWSYLVEQNLLGAPKDFIRSVPHMSFVHGNDNVEYLRKRFEAMQQYELYEGMEFSDDPEKIKEWIPLVIEGRDFTEKVAANRIGLGTDVNYGVLTRTLISNLEKSGNITVHLQQEVEDLKQLPDGKWEADVKDLAHGGHKTVTAGFVFIGAGGGSLHLLQKAHIPEGKKYAGFPVGGQWLVCKVPEVVAKHHAKVYGQASVGAPPMSVPHLDTRIIDGEAAILFGPFATFSTKFLKEGSFWDLLVSVKFWNIIPLMRVGVDNFDLEKYLVQQLALSFEDRIDALRVFYPEAKAEDWSLLAAGQRVQVIYNEEGKGGELKFGTEVVTSEDGTLGALLGASPGASTSVSIMLSLLHTCFPKQMAGEWLPKLKTMIPSYGQHLEGNKELCYQVRTRTSSTLQLDWVQPKP